MLALDRDLMLFVLFVEVRKIDVCSGLAPEIADQNSLAQPHVQSGSNINARRDSLELYVIHALEDESDTQARLRGGTVRVDARGVARVNRHPVHAAEGRVEILLVDCLPDALESLLPQFSGRISPDRHPAPGVVAHASPSGLGYRGTERVKEDGADGQ